MRGDEALSRYYQAEIGDSDSKKETEVPPKVSTTDPVTQAAAPTPVAVAVPIIVSAKDSKMPVKEGLGDKADNSDKQRLTRRKAEICFMQEGFRSSKYAALVLSVIFCFFIS